MNANIFIESCELALYILFSSGCSIVQISCGNTLHALNNPATVSIFLFDDNNELGIYPSKSEYANISLIFFNELMSLNNSGGTIGYPYILPVTKSVLNVLDE